MNRTLLVLAVMILAPVSLMAQTNDHIWRSWTFATDTTSPRAAGLGGAFVAVGDDDALAYTNPAGLTSLRKNSLSASVLARNASTLASGDASDSHVGPGYIAGVAIRSKFALAGYLTQPRAGRIGLSPFELPDRTEDEGSLLYTVTEVGGAFAWQLSPHVSVGARLTATHLSLQGDYSRLDRGSVDLRTGTASGSTRLTGSLGVALESGRLRAAAVIHPGASYQADRTSIDPAHGQIPDAGSAYNVRQPSSVTMGVAYELSARVLLTGQLDYVRYSEVEFIARQAATDPSQYKLEDAVEPRAGIEVSFPLHTMSLQLRGGVHSQAAASARFTGQDPVESVVFQGGERAIRPALGGSLVMRSVRLDVAAIFGGEHDAVVAGFGVRF